MLGLTTVVSQGHALSVLLVLHSHFQQCLQERQSRAIDCRYDDIVGNRFLSQAGGFSMLEVLLITPHDSRVTVSKGKPVRAYIKQIHRQVSGFFEAGHQAQDHPVAPPPISAAPGGRPP